MRPVVLVTGGSGFIGSHVVDRLIAAGMAPRIFDRRPSPWHDPDRVPTVIGDITRIDDLTRAVRGCDAICHLAAAADVGEVSAHPLWATELNGGGTLNVLEAAREADVRRVVYASTVWVYSDVDAAWVDEDTPLRAPAHLYTAGKLSGELYCRSYGELYGLETTILRFGIPYGPRARPAAVIPSFVDRAMRGEPLTIAGTGEQERSFVYVEDLADGVVRALAPAAIGRTYNLGGSETVTIRRLAEIVGEVVGDGTIVHGPGRTGDLRGAEIDSARARRELGWQAATPLEDGVQRYVDWLREQPAGPAPAPPARRGQDVHRLASVIAGGDPQPGDRRARRARRGRLRRRVGDPGHARGGAGRRLHPAEPLPPPAAVDARRRPLAGRAPPPPVGRHRAARRDRRPAARAAVLVRRRRRRAHGADRVRAPALRLPDERAARRPAAPGRGAIVGCPQGVS